MVLLNTEENRDLPQEHYFTGWSQCIGHALYGKYLVKDIQHTPSCEFLQRNLRTLRDGQNVQKVNFKPQGGKFMWF